MFKHLPWSPVAQSQRPPQHPAYTASRSNTATHPIASPSPTEWLLDSGASLHVTMDLANLALHSPYDGVDDIVIGNGKGSAITHTGSLSLSSPSTSISLSNLYVSCL